MRAPTRLSARARSLCNAQNVIIFLLGAAGVCLTALIHLRFGRIKSSPPLDRFATERRRAHESFVATLEPWDAHIRGVAPAAARGALALAPAAARAPKRTLVVYAYAHAMWRQRNLEFFLRHGLVARSSDGAEVDYTFVMNGFDAPLDVFHAARVAFTLAHIPPGANWTNAGPGVAGVGGGRGNADGSGEGNGRGGDFGGDGDGGGDNNGPGDAPRVHVVVRENSGFDMCASRIVLERGLAARPGTYTHVVLMNGSVRGPFMPSYTTLTWVDAFQQFLVGNVRLVGTTINCLSSLHDSTAGFTSLHVQSMVLALDAEGARAVLPMLNCYATMVEAISHGEIGSSQALLAAGFGAAVLQASWRGFPVFARDLASAEVARRCAAVLNETGGDPAAPGVYAGGEPHALELIFIKTNRNLDEAQLSHETQLRESFGR
jgi:hypothetical protein